MGIALVTPFKADMSVDYDALQRLVEFQVSSGADFLCVLCTTAETPTLTPEERAKVRQVVTDQVRGRVPIVIGCGGNNTMAVVNELRYTDWRGVDAVWCPITTNPRRRASISISRPLPRLRLSLSSSTTCRVV